MAAIRSAAHGEVIFSAELARRMTQWFGGMEQSRAPLVQLTPREREVLTLLARGRDNGAIGSLLGVSDKTVRNVVSNVLTKLAVRDRAAAIVLARDNGLGLD